MFVATFLKKVVLPDNRFENTFIQVILKTAAETIVRVIDIVALTFGNNGGKEAASVGNLSSIRGNHISVCT